jgi:transposase
MTKYEPGPRRALVLAMAREGKSAREIARTLDLSMTTTYEHLRELERRGLLAKAAK